MVLNSAFKGLIHMNRHTLIQNLSIFLSINFVTQFCRENNLQLALHRDTPNDTGSIPHAKHFYFQYIIYEILQLTYIKFRILLALIIVTNSYIQGVVFNLKVDRILI
jgi:hypothetical protein